MRLQHTSRVGVSSSCESPRRGHISNWSDPSASALLFAALTAQAEIPALFAQRPIVLRQSKAAMYYPFIDALALTLVDMPIAFFTLVIFSILLYFIVGLQQTAGQFL